LTVVSIAHATGFYGWAFWFTALLCVISFFINVGYVLLLRMLHEGPSAQDLVRLKRKKEFNYRKLLRFPHTYWLIVLLEFVMGSIWSSFLHINTELVKTRWGVSDTTAAYNSSISQFLPIFVAPFLGYLMDRYGQRCFAIILSTGTLTLSMLLLGFTYIYPVVGMAIFSISLTLGPVAITSAVPLILPLDCVGSALGIFKSATNIGTTILDISVGFLQDLSGGKYDDVMVCFLVLSAFSMAASGVLLLVERKVYNGVLDMSDTKRSEFMGEKARNAEAENSTAGRVSMWNWAYVGTLVILLITSWVLFILFVML